MRRVYTLYSEAKGERKDCAVRAVAVAFSLPYSESYARFAAAGREPGKATPRYISRDVITALGGCRLDEWKGKTLARFLREAPAGRYVVGVTGHAIAVIDGVVHDHKDSGVGPRYRVRRVYKV